MRGEWIFTSCVDCDSILALVAAWFDYLRPLTIAEFLYEAQVLGSTSNEAARDLFKACRCPTLITKFPVDEVDSRARSWLNVFCRWSRTRNQLSDMWKHSLIVLLEVRSPGAVAWDSFRFASNKTIIKVGHATQYVANLNRWHITCSQFCQLSP
jgi:hypothetical protein